MNVRLETSLTMADVEDIRRYLNDLATKVAQQFEEIEALTAERDAALQRIEELEAQSVTERKLFTQMREDSLTGARSRIEELEVHDA